MSGAIPGVHTLPDEILDHIFTALTCQLHPNFGLQLNDRNGAASEPAFPGEDNWLPDPCQIVNTIQHSNGRGPKLPIRHVRLVCKRWHIICDQPRNGHFWISSIYINCGADNLEKQIAVAKERLETSRNCDFDITIYFGFSMPMAVGKSDTYSQELPERTRLCLHFWRILVQFQTQWRIVRLHTGMPVALGVMFCDLNALMRTSSLIWLSINDDGGGFESGYYCPDITSTASHLYIDPASAGINLPPFSAQYYHGLMHLSTQAVELTRLDIPVGLRSLSLVTWQVGATRKILPWHELLNTLKRGSALHRLDVCLMDISEMPSFSSESIEVGQDKITLPQVRHIHLEGMLPQLLVFLSTVEMPALETFNITFFGETTSDLRLPHWRINTFPKLTRIATKHTEVHELMFLSMLVMPSLQSIDLRLYWQSNGEFIWPHPELIGFQAPEHMKLVNAKPEDFSLLLQSSDVARVQCLEIGPSSTIPGHGSSGKALEADGVLSFPSLECLSINSPPTSDHGGYLNFINAPRLTALFFERISDTADLQHDDWIQVCLKHRLCFAKLKKIKFFCPAFNYELTSQLPNPFTFFPAIEDMEVTFRLGDDLAWLMQPPTSGTQEEDQARTEHNPPVFGVMKELRNLTISLMEYISTEDETEPDLEEDATVGQTGAPFIRANVLFDTAKQTFKHKFVLRLKTRRSGRFEFEESLRLEHNPS